MDQQTENKILTAVIKFISSFFSKEGPEVQIQIPIDPQPAASVEAPKSVQKPVQKSAPKFVLTRTRFCADGIFGELKTADGGFVAYTLEHSYDNKPKLVNGIYTCKRGPHRLHGMTQDFTTFEVMGVPNFNGVPVTGILFHWGNYDKDSEGCILMGSSETPTMIGNSRQTWSDFMNSLNGVDNFELEVT
ncbi:unnamed protein product [Sphagnum balticum]